MYFTLCSLGRESDNPLLALPFSSTPVSSWWFFLVFIPLKRYMEKPAGSRHQSYHLRHLTLSDPIEYVWEQVQSWARGERKVLLYVSLFFPSHSSSYWVRVRERSQVIRKLRQSCFWATAGNQKGRVCFINILWRGIISFMTSRRLTCLPSILCSGVTAQNVCIIYEEYRNWSIKFQKINYGWSVFACVVRCT